MASRPGRFPICRADFFGSGTIVIGVASPHAISTRGIGINRQRSRIQGIAAAQSTCGQNVRRATIAKEPCLVRRTTRDPGHAPMSVAGPIAEYQRSGTSPAGTLVADIIHAVVFGALDLVRVTVVEDDYVTVRPHANRRPIDR